MKHLSMEVAMEMKITFYHYINVNRVAPVSKCMCLIFYFLQILYFKFFYRLPSNMYKGVLYSWKRCYLFIVSTNYKYVFINNYKSYRPNFDCEIDDCAITNCQACYYSYNVLPMPSNCSQICENPFDEVCMIEWGRCIRRHFLEIYNEVSYYRILIARIHLLYKSIPCISHNIDTFVIPF